MAELRPARHPVCPVCEGIGGWDRSGAPTNGPGRATTCPYCGGKGKCEPCERLGEHPIQGGYGSR